MTPSNAAASEPLGAEPIRKLLAEVLLFFHDCSDSIRCIDRVVDLEERIGDALATPTHQAAEQTRCPVCHATYPCQHSLTSTTAKWATTLHQAAPVVPFEAGEVVQTVADFSGSLHQAAEPAPADKLRAEMRTLGYSDTAINAMGDSTTMMQRAIDARKMLMAAEPAPREVERLRSALGRLLPSYLAILARRPVRDVEETIAEAQSALAPQAVSEPPAGVAAWDANCPRPGYCINPTKCERKKQCIEAPHQAAEPAASELERSTYGVGLIKFSAPETALRYLAKRLREAGIDSSVADDYAQSIEFLLARRDDLGPLEPLAAQPQSAASYTVLSPAQAIELLQEALGVEVEFTRPIFCPGCDMPQCRDIGKCAWNPPAAPPAPTPALPDEVARTDSERLEARRYRWIRERCSTLDCHIEVMGAGLEITDTLDEAIDAAIASQEAKS